MHKFHLKLMDIFSFIAHCSAEKFPKYFAKKPLKETNITENCAGECKYCKQFAKCTIRDGRLNNYGL